MVYNFTVADYHTYYVTDLGIWVHNTWCFDADAFEKKISKMSFKAGKKFDGKMVKVPNRKYSGRYGWKDKDGNIWVPAKAGESHGGLQFDVQLKSSNYTKHKNVFVSNK